MVDTAGKRTLGKRYDGGQTFSDQDWRVGVATDYERIKEGSPPRVGEWMDQQIRSWGFDPERMHELPEGRRRKLVKKLQAEIKRLDDEIFVEKTARLAKEPSPHYVPGGTVETVDAIGAGITHRGGLPPKFFLHNNGLGQSLLDFETHHRSRRTDLHAWLQGWARGPLAMEHPQGSSYHHLETYDRIVNAAYGAGPSLAEMEREFGRPQIFVVERDWAKAFSGYDLANGEVRMPFDHCCFEFRISGVRVIAFVRNQLGNGTLMFCVYGKEGVWVVDDYFYFVHDGLFHRTTHSNDLKHERYEFPRVNQMIWNEIRVASIMVDANVAEAVAHDPSPKLIKRSAGVGKSPPRKYFIVDLKRRTHYAPRSSGPGVPTGVKMRGHFRRGTWVHYQDPESGQVKYVNDGGFWLSRTWRPWHFAGDPNNIIEKEYRL